MNILLKRIFVITTLLGVFLNNHVYAQKEAQYSILLSGASFASPDNGWFELGCEKLGVKPINKAIGGEAITDAANRMVKDLLYTSEELEDIDAFVIMHVHNKNVADESNLCEKHSDYTVPFDRTDYSAAYDYVIKKYISDCYGLINNPKSKYYKSKSGKPVIIILCTDWHDARTTYNTSVRALAQKWGFPLVEFDRYIGFSKKCQHPETNEQVSLLYSLDTQDIDGVVYGWHPERGTDKYIQQRMAAIFVDAAKKIFLGK